MKKLGLWDKDNKQWVYNRLKYVITKMKNEKDQWKMIVAEDIESLTLLNSEWVGNAEELKTKVLPIKVKDPLSDSTFIAKAWCLPQINSEIDPASL